LKPVAETGFGMLYDYINTPVRELIRFNYEKEISLLRGDKILADALALMA
jgi:hypothetical protein